MKTNVGASVYETVALPLSYVGTGQNQAGEGENSTFTPHLHHTREATSVAAGGLLPDQIPPSSGIRPHACEALPDEECACVDDDNRYFNPEVEADFRALMNFASTPEEAARHAALWRAEAARWCVASGRRVYVVQSNGLVKIGIADNVRRRVRALQTGAAAKVRLVGDVPGTREMESALHRRFAVAHSHGEWFAPTEDVLLLVRAISGQRKQMERLDAVLSLLPDRWWQHSTSLPLKSAQARLRHARRDDSKPQTAPSVESRPGAGVGSLSDASRPINCAVPSPTEAR